MGVKRFPLLVLATPLPFLVFSFLPSLQKKRVVSTTPALPWLMELSPPFLFEYPLLKLKSSEHRPSSPPSFLPVGGGVFSPLFLLSFGEAESGVVISIRPSFSLGARSSLSPLGGGVLTLVRYSDGEESHEHQTASLSWRTASPECGSPSESAAS